MNSKGEYDSSSPSPPSSTTEDSSIGIFVESSTTEESSNNISYGSSARSGSGSSRPQNFDSGKKVNGKRPCLWSCGCAFSEEHMDHHVNYACGRMNDVDKFKKDFERSELVAERHPHGRPHVLSPQKEFLDLVRKESAEDKLKGKSRKGFLDQYFRYRQECDWPFKKQ